MSFSSGGVKPFLNCCFIGLKKVSADPWSSVPSFYEASSVVKASSVPLPSFQTTLLRTAAQTGCGSNPGDALISEAKCSSFGSFGRGRYMLVRLCLRTMVRSGSNRWMLADSNGLSGSVKANTT